MPSAPPKPCREPGCAALVATGEGYCAAHKRQTYKRLDAERGNSNARGYGSTWRRRIRPAALSGEPLCRFCAEAGRVVAATEVDHIDGNSRNNAAGNLRPLCKPCHSARTARDQGFAAPASRTHRNGA